MNNEVITYRYIFPTSVIALANFIDNITDSDNLPSMTLTLMNDNNLIITNLNYV